MTRNAIAQKGISPKLLADLIVSVLTFLLTYFGVELDPTLSAAIAKLAGFAAGAIVGPGRVVVEKVGPASDSLLPSHAVNAPEAP